MSDGQQLGSSCGLATSDVTEHGKIRTEVVHALHVCLNSRQLEGVAYTVCKELSPQVWRTDDSIKQLATALELEKVSRLGVSYEAEAGL